MGSLQVSEKSDSFLGSNLSMPSSLIHPNGRSKSTIQIPSSSTAVLQTRKSARLTLSSFLLKPCRCIGHQMVGVINPNASVSVEIQQEYAANSSFMLLPGQPWPDESDPLATTSTSTATAVITTSLASTVTPTPTPTAVAPTATAEPAVSHKSTLSAGPIAGIAIGKPSLSNLFAVSHSF